MAVDKHIALGNISRGEWRRAEATIRPYAKAWKAFRDEQDRQPKLLTGNDNKVGIAGEYWAMRYYQQRLGRMLKDRPKSRSNEGYDFRYAAGRRPVKVSVKSLSSENKYRKTVQMKKSELWGELVLVSLDDNLRPTRIGRITRAQFRQAVNGTKTRAISETPVMSERCMNAKGWMNIYGKVEFNPF